MKRSLLRFLFCIIFIWTYFFISIRINSRFYTAFSLAAYVIIALFIICEGFRMVRRKDESLSSRVIEAAAIILLSAIMFYRKAYIDDGNLIILKRNSKNVSVFEVMENSTEERNRAEKYDSLFQTKDYKDNTIYYTDEFEPALKLVYAYLDKAKIDNSNLFGDIPAVEFTVKFDYDEDVFKKRDPAPRDYSGLYYSQDHTAYVYIKDCYSQALAHSLGSSYLRQVLLHEYTHHVFYEFIDIEHIPEEHIPLWFIEGISEYISNEGYSGNPPLNMTAFSELTTREQWTDYCNKGSNVYEQSHYAVRRLILMKGEEIIKDILIKAGDKDFDTAFNEATGISFKDYEKLLNDDFKSGWKKFYKMVPAYTAIFFPGIQAQCLEEYTNMNPDNINALLDLALDYEGSNQINRERLILNMAVERGPQNTLAWHRMAMFYERMKDFGSAIKAYEKVISIDKDSAAGYSYLAHAWLTRDVNKAAEAVQKARNIENSSYNRKQADAILAYQSSVKNDKPYEGCLQLIKSDIIHDDNIKAAIIDRLLEEYPHVENSAKSELESIKSRLR